MNAIERWTSFVHKARRFPPSAMILIATLVLILASLLAGSAWFDHYERERYLSSLQTQLAVRARFDSEELSKTFTELRRDVQFLALTPAVQSFIRASRNQGVDPKYGVSITGWQGRLAEVFSAFSNSRPQLIRLRYIGLADQGRELVRVNRLDGQSVIIAQEDLQLTDDLTFFEATKNMKVGEVFLSDLSLHRENGAVQNPPQPVVHACTPVHAPDGEPFGMICLTMSIDPLLHRIPAGLPQGVQFFMMNDQGDYLIHDDATCAFGFDLGQRCRWQDDFPGIELTQATDINAANAMPNLLSAPSAKGLQHIYLAKVGFGPLQTQRALFLAYVLPDAAVSAATTPIRHLIEGIALALALILIILFLLYLWRVLIPLQRLTEVARRIGGGDYPASLPKVSYGETTTLSAAFNTMLAQIERRELDVARANEQLQTGMEYANHIIDSAPGAMLVSDNRGRIVRVNRLTEQTFGYAQHELLGQPVEILVPTTLRAQHRLDHSNYMNSPEHREDDFAPQRMNPDKKVFARHKDGHAIQVEVSLSIFKIGGARHVIAGIADVTERVAAEDALRQSEERMRLMIDGVKDYAIITLDQHGLVTSWNEAAKRLKGYDANEIIGLPMQQFYTPEDIAADKPAQLLSMAREKGRSEDQGWRMRKDGSRFYADVILSAIYSDAGNLLGFAKITRDVTERRAAETLAECDREQQTALRELLELTTASSTLNEMLKQFIERLMQVSWLSLNPKAGISLIDNDAARPLRLMISHQLPPQIETLCARIALGQCHCGQAAASGKLQYAQCLNERHTVRYPGMEDHGNYAVPLISDQRTLGVLMIYLPTDFKRTTQTDQFIASAADILAGAVSRQRAEQALIDHQLHLEEKVAERTAQLEASKLEAERLSKVKDTFLATMSHEIRTPMNALLGMLELLGLGGLNKDQMRMLDVTQESGRLLLRIIDDILDFSKIEAGKLDIHPEPSSIAELIELSANFFRPIASSKGLLLFHTVSPDISPVLMADRLRLRQIINNFISNAIKFTLQGKIEIRAELVEHLEGMDRVRLMVSDTGVGVSPEAQTQLFQPFTQADADTTRRFGGTGLGLVICQRLADIMNGKIKMESTLGQGTTLSLTIDLPVPDASYLEQIRQQLNSPSNPFDLQVSGQDIRQQALVAPILLVDDHPTNREVLTEQLRRLGYPSEQAASSQEALQRWKSGGYRLLITDLHMPDMDGYQLTREIRQLEADSARTRTPILAWSADALPEVGAACAAAGMDDLLVKPADLRSLKAKLNKIFQQPSARKNDAVELSSPSPASHQDMLSDGALDWTVLAELSGGDDVVNRKILARFRAANHPDTAALIQAVAARDADEVSRLGHRIKGAARMIGAHQYALACEALEKAGKNHDWTAIEAGVVAFKKTRELLGRAMG